MLFVIALLFSWPAEWSAVAHPNAAQGENNDRALLEEAWSSPLVIGRDRQIMLNGIKLHTDEAGTDWRAARLYYVEHRAKALTDNAATDAALRDSSWAKKPNRTTRCTSTSSRYYPSVTTTCTTTQN